ncbi:MAG TPA: multidrug ABC transporter ATP-binding protein, partial [Anaerolineaceae bacterium]|nr:multidrug ABC transporter ATP-binding protein [Anaerolineaceae bacterium]
KSHLIEVDTPENLREKLYGRNVVFHLRELNPVWVEGVKSLSGVKDVQAIEQKLLVGMDEPESVNPRIIRWLVAAGADLLFVGELRHSLEEIYIQTIQETGETEVAA